jgi:hypothetical protein
MAAEVATGVGAASVVGYLPSPPRGRVRLPGVPLGLGSVDAGDGPVDVVVQADNEAVRQGLDRAQGEWTAEHVTGLESERHEDPLGVDVFVTPLSGLSQVGSARSTQPHPLGRGGSALPAEGLIERREALSQHAGRQPGRCMVVRTTSASPVMPAYEVRGRSHRASVRTAGTILKVVISQVSDPPEVEGNPQ